MLLDLQTAGVRPQVLKRPMRGKRPTHFYGAVLRLTGASQGQLLFVFFFEELESWSPSPERWREGSQNQSLRHEDTKKGEEKGSNKSPCHLEQAWGKLVPLGQVQQQAGRIHRNMSTTHTLTLGGAKSLLAAEVQTA